MPDKIREPTRVIRRQLHSRAISKLPALSATELTRSTWAMPINSPDQVPNIYKDFFDTLRSEGREFPINVPTPSFEQLLHRTSEKLICDTGDEIDILEKKGNGFQVKRFPIDNIICVEHKMMLLDSHIKICGVTNQGVSTSSTIRFNTVTDYLLIPFLERMRGAAWNSNTVLPSLELTKFDYLGASNYKFMNYAKRSLLGNERVIQVVFQPEIRENVWSLLDKAYYRIISPTHMAILTDRELIFICENEDRRGRDKYGGIWDYIPLKHVQSVSLSEKDIQLLELSIKLPENERLNFLYAKSQQQIISQFLGAINLAAPQIYIDSHEHINYVQM